MAQASVFQTEYAGSIPAIHSKACNAKRSSEQSFTLSNSGFEPRARHQYLQTFPPKFSRVNFDLDPYGMGLRCKRRSSRFDSERDLQWKRCKSAEHIVLKTTGVKTLGSSSLPASSNARAVFTVETWKPRFRHERHSGHESESRLAKGIRFQIVSLKVRILPDSPLNDECRSETDCL